MKLVINMDALTLDDMILIDEGIKNVREIKNFLARFGVGDDGQPIPYEEACVALGKFTLRDLKAAMDQMKTSIGELNEAAVPPETSGG